MAVPKQRKTKSRRNQRRMHIFLKEPSLTDCQNCKEKTLRHTVCHNCGYYKGRQVIDVMKDLTKKEKKEKEKEMEEKRAEKPLNMEDLSS